jgi:hypothetical protein
MVGYENVTAEEQGGIVQGLLNEMKLMMYDGIDDDALTYKSPDHSLSSGIDGFSDEFRVPESFTYTNSTTAPVPLTEILVTTSSHVNQPHRGEADSEVPPCHLDSYSLATSADSTNFRQLKSADVTSTLLITLLGSRMTVEKSVLSMTRAPRNPLSRQ